MIPILSVTLATHAAKTVEPGVRPFFRELIAEFRRHQVPLLAAALSYATVFALPPLLVITLAIVGSVFGQEAARGEVQRQVQSVAGAQGAAAIESIIESASRPGSHRGLAAWLGVGALFAGSTGVFLQLQQALNIIWGVRPKKDRGVLWRLLRKRLLSFGLVVMVGVLLLASMLLTAALAAFSSHLQGLHPGSILVRAVEVLDFLVSEIVITVLMCAIFMILPDARIRFRYVWVGAALTALLLTAGKALIGLYLGKAAPGSAYGAAGSFVVILVWIYYSSILVFCGAEFTQVYARLRGGGVEPEKLAVRAE